MVFWSKPVQVLFVVPVCVVFEELQAVSWTPSGRFSFDEQRSGIGGERLGGSPLLSLHHGSVGGERRQPALLSAASESVGNQPLRGCSPCRASSAR